MTLPLIQPHPVVEHLDRMLLHTREERDSALARLGAAQVAIYSLQREVRVLQDYITARGTHE